jgi:hypothetical protein
LNPARPPSAQPRELRRDRLTSAPETAAGRAFHNLWKLQLACRINFPEINIKSKLPIPIQLARLNLPEIFSRLLLPFDFRIGFVFRGLHRIF